MVLDLDKLDVALGALEFRKLIDDDFFTKSKVFIFFYYDFWVKQYWGHSLVLFGKTIISFTLFHR